MELVITFVSDICFIYINKYIHIYTYRERLSVHLVLINLYILLTDKPRRGKQGGPNTILSYSDTESEYE
jgi:hypothetical protein